MIVVDEIEGSGHAKCEDNVDKKMFGTHVLAFSDLCKQPFIPPRFKSKLICICGELKKLIHPVFHWLLALMERAFIHYSIKGEVNQKKGRTLCINKKA
jgi:hypothetical protein